MKKTLTRYFALFTSLKMENVVQSKVNEVEPLVFSCDKCEKEFIRRSLLTRHLHSKHEPIDVTLCKVNLNIKTNYIRIPCTLAK